MRIETWHLKINDIIPIHFTNDGKYLMKITEEIYEGIGTNLLCVKGIVPFLNERTSHIIIAVFDENLNRWEAVWV